MNDDAVQGDDHLRAALRHAPDASSAAPIALSAQISAAARQATRDDKGNLWSRLWAWLGQPGRLGASGAFATLALAGVLTLVWHGETPAPIVEKPKAMPPAPAAPTVTDSASAGPAPTQPSAVQASTASAPPAVAAKTAARAVARAADTATAPTAALAAPAPVQEAVAEAMPSRADDAKVAAEAPAVVAPPMARREAASMSRPPAMPAISAISAIPAAPAVAAAPAPQAKAAAADSAQERSRFTLGSNRAAPPGADIAAWLDAATERPSAAAAMAAPGQPASARRLATAMLSELQSLGAGRWRDSSTPEGTAQVELWQAGRHSASLWLNDDAVVVCLTSAQRCQRSTLSTAQIEALRATLSR